MAHSPEFSIPKSELTPEQLDQYLEGVETRKTIKENVERALGSEIVEEKNGIFQFEDFPSHFTFDGALRTKQNPKHAGKYGQFFIIEGRYSQKGNDYLLRGVHYLVSIDPTLEVRQKLRILWRDFEDAMELLIADSNTISDEYYIEQSAVLDYAKNASVTLLNALVQKEKVGDFHLDDTDYQNIRSIAIRLAQKATRAYYSHLIGAKEDFASAVADLKSDHENLYHVRDYIENQYSEGIFTYRHFTRPEASHPLVIAASIFTAASKIEPLPQTIIGLPSGGTEIALAQQYAYEKTKQHPTELVLIPLSLHSIKDAFGMDTIAEDEFRAFLRHNQSFFEGKHVLIVEDNSSTGRTIQVLHDMLTRTFNISKIHVSVAEADLIRSHIDRESTQRTHIASEAAYVHSVNILPVSRTIQPKVDLKEIAEKRRLAAEYQRQLDESETLAEKIMYRSFMKMCEIPTEDVLPELNNENAILEFRHTFLSNFYAIPIVYAGQTFPSVEHTYHSQKFTPTILRSVSRECLNEINETLRVRGRLNAYEDAAAIFSDQTLSSGNAKVIADILRKYGYVRHDWDNDKMVLMSELLLQKFGNQNLAERLLLTGDKYLVEGNTWNDTLWGVCEGRGRNLLGLMLMEIRQVLHSHSGNLEK